VPGLTKKLTSPRAGSSLFFPSTFFLVAMVLVFHLQKVSENSGYCHYERQLVISGGSLSFRVTPQRCAHFFLEETGVLRVEWEAVQTAKAGPTLVFSNPISSMVPIIGGFFIGGPIGTPFRSVRTLSMIGSGPIFL
jgi:hypothetical protein